MRQQLNDALLRQKGEKMEEKKIEFEHRYKCPTCFLNWYKVMKNPQEGKTIRKCAICFHFEDNKMPLKALVDRQVEVIERTDVSNFPKVIQNLWKYIKEKT